MPTARPLPQAEHVDILHEEDKGEKDEKDEKAPATKAVAPADRVTTRYMTKYEKARILGTRALQLRCVGAGPRGRGQARGSPTASTRTMRRAPRRPTHTPCTPAA